MPRPHPHATQGTRPIATSTFTTPCRWQARSPTTTAAPASTPRARNGQGRPPHPRHPRGSHLPQEPRQRRPRHQGLPRRAHQSHDLPLRPLRHPRCHLGVLPALHTWCPPQHHVLPGLPADPHRFCHFLLHTPCLLWGARRPPHLDLAGHHLPARRRHHRRCVSHLRPRGRLVRLCGNGHLLCSSRTASCGASSTCILSCTL